jgi:hypothetical protein
MRFTPEWQGFWLGRCQLLEGLHGLGIFGEDVKGVFVKTSPALIAE